MLCDPTTVANYCRSVTGPVCCMLPHKHVGWFGSQKGVTKDSGVMLENEIRYTQLSEERELLSAPCCSHLSFWCFLHSGTPHSIVFQQCRNSLKGTLWMYRILKALWRSFAVSGSLFRLVHTNEDSQACSDQWCQRFAAMWQQRQGRRRLLAGENRCNEYRIQTVFLREEVHLSRLLNLKCTQCVLVSNTVV